MLRPEEGSGGSWGFTQFSSLEGFAQGAMEHPHVVKGASVWGAVRLGVVWTGIDLLGPQRGAAGALQGARHGDHHCPALRSAQKLLPDGSLSLSPQSQKMCLTQTLPPLFFLRVTGTS